MIDRGASVIPEHSHDWPVLSIFVIGAYRNTTELGPLDIHGPSAMLYGAGAAHQNDIGPTGFEQIEIEFDPAWLGAEALPAPGVSPWIGGLAAAAARGLGAICMTTPGEAQLQFAMRRFISEARGEARPSSPRWLDHVNLRLRHDQGLAVGDLAREVGRHPAWLGSAYARAVGETLPRTIARLRVERAVQLLRETDEPAAAVAASAGFFDQSHMIRSFRRVLGRLPSAVRRERIHFRSA